ncbi:type II toxin-antitoxin system HicA family toxin [Salmonella enterica]|uniref:Type II toxin-antitoxin system HicA family toxin n=2 Tax=Salmonella enterica I TaxID=59201 RepID=A0A5U3G7N2_SALET|nr:type II toxin-antitoxin system HicA family toxin [Salmonella enterica]EBH9884376.1 type II toxin-antitoxin system HicA family toxin [Salmonella enterica subsp. enterica serovar Kisarawe]EBP4061194.1 type II toxin-antitoxin system HicA family toxin [Salmonella enterica subsp. enterica]EBS0228771.1 type II toxin-antitoxin system HicA family toxin [Salmonella enterica subsp. enterica serovar Schwarzengrund]EAS5879371.1 type II toxin-antitoxin system HicA family toxin [Salmonella enterica]
MGKLDKLRDAFLQSRKTFAWAELVSLLNLLGYEKKEMQGSRVRFYNQKIDHTILMHRPHPENYIKGGTIKAVKETLKEVGLL